MGFDGGFALAGGAVGDDVGEVVAEALDAGAVARHARIGDPFAAMAPALIVGIASAATLGLRLLTT